MLKAAIVNVNFPDYELEKKLLEDAGIEADFWVDVPPDEILSKIKDADALIVQLEKVPADWFPIMPNLKVISRGGIGVDAIDLEAAARHNVPVLNVPDYCIEEVADHACAMILAAHRKLFASFQLVKDGQWREANRYLKPIHRLSDLTLGLIGMGRIGAEVIARMKGFKCRLIVSDPYLKEDAVPAGVELLSFDEVLEQSDILTIHCPLTEETKNLLNRNAFAKMKKAPIVVNVSRGPIIQERDLIEALDEGKISFAALDVLNTEPPASDYELLHHPKVIITNHLAWYSEESEIKLRTLTISRMIDYLQGRPVPSIVNHKQLTSQ